MKKIQLLVWIWVCCFSLTALSQEVVYSDYESFDFRTGDFAVIGKTGDFVYTYHASCNNYYLDAYNQDMKKEAIVLLDFLPAKIQNTRFINYPDKIIMLYQVYERTELFQYAVLLDHTGRLQKGPLKITSMKTGLFGSSSKQFYDAVSDNKEKIFVYKLEEKGPVLRLNGIWLDDKLTVTARGAAQFSTENDLTFSEGILQNNGSFFLPVYTPVGSRGYMDRLWILQLAEGGRSFYAAEMPLNDLFATKIYMKEDPYRNRIYTGGFYSHRKNGDYDGVLYAYYDIQDSSFQNHKMIAFSNELRAATGERSARKAFNDYLPRHMIIKKDGGFVLISEQFYVTTQNYNPGFGGYYSFYYGPMTSQLIREYNYNDIFAISYDGDGNDQWHAFVRKSQYSQEDGGVFSSFAMVNTGGALGFLFNDYNTTQSRIQFAALDAGGNIDMLSLAAGTRDDPDWIPRAGKQVGLREMIVPCLRKKQICFAKIIF